MARRRGGRNRAATVDAAHDRASRDGERLRRVAWRHRLLIGGQCAGVCIQHARAHHGCDRELDLVSAAGVRWRHTDRRGGRGELHGEDRLLPRGGPQPKRPAGSDLSGHGVPSQTGTCPEPKAESREPIMPDAYIVGGVRTPIGNLAGGLSDVRADDLAAHTIAELIRRYPTIDPADIADVILRCANQAGEDNRNVARMALLLAGLPHSVPGETVNRLCASGMSAVAIAARAASAGDGDLFIAGGVESMTRAPYALSKASKPWARDVEIFDTSLGWRFVNPKMKERYGTDSMGQTAENVAEQYAVSREDQDCFALRSQQKAAAARSGGRFAAEIVPVEIPQKKGDTKRFEQDEFLRPESTIEALGKLKPAFRLDGKGSV